MPLVSPVTVSVVAVALKVWVAWAVAPDVGGDHVAGDGRAAVGGRGGPGEGHRGVAEVPDTPVGAPGVVAGVTELDWAEAVPVPTMLMAATVKV